MSKPDKQRAGLQRKVSSVFEGVVIPGTKSVGGPCPVPADEHDVVSSDAAPGNCGIPKVRDCGRDTSKLISPQPEAAQSPAPESPAAVEKPAVYIEPNEPTEAAPPVSKPRQAAQSSLLKKLAQSDEPEDRFACPPSVSAAPEGARASGIGRTASDKARDSAKQSPINKPAQQSTLLKKLAQSDEPGNEAVSEETADMPLPTTPERQTSPNHRLKNGRNPEASPVSAAQSKYPAADSFVDSGEAGGFLRQIKEKLIPSEAEGGSTKKKVMVMLVPILAIVMIFTFRQVLHKSPGKASAAQKKEQKIVNAAGAGNEIEWKIPDPLPIMTRDPLQLPEDKDSEKQDEAAGPTNPAQDAVTKADRIRNGVVNVRDIVYSEDKASALIGDRIVYNGSKIDGVTIVKINRDSVEFESNGETWVQKMRD